MKYILLFFLVISNIAVKAINTDSVTKLNNLILELSNCKSDESKLDKLFEIHYYQQALIGELTELNINNFNTEYTKQGIQLAIKLNKYDTLKALTVDIGFIFDLRKEYDSSFVYYNNCLNIFENANKYELAFTITQNIFYNSSLLQGIIKENNKKEFAQKQKIDRLTTVAILALLLFVAFLIFFFVKSKRNNKLLIKQKDVIEKSKNEIDSSINYAQNIQHAILSNEVKLQKIFKNSFVLFMPRDKVSGDFLWTYKKDNLVFVAVADCTGHGVPGALLSIVGSFLFDSIISSSAHSLPSVILEKLHNAVINSLDQNSEGNDNNRDGMDVGLIKIDLTTNTIIFSGAHRSLYLVKNNVITEYKSAKRPVGGTQIIYTKPFLDVEIKAEKDDIIYCYSDGYSDQMGGVKNKKFMNSNLIKLLTDNSNLDLSQQKEIYKNTFINYKGSNSQTDDVLLVALKF